MTLRTLRRPLAHGAEVASAGLPSGAPRVPLLLGELLSGIEALRLARHVGRLRGAPRGSGRPVVVLPGWLAPELSVEPLRRYLSRLGHDARTWGIGVNRGDVARDASRVIRDLEAAAGEPTALVGWSLGGTVAREVARRRPELVRSVVHFGSPVVGGPAHTIAARRGDPDELDRLARRSAEREATDPLQVPVTAIFTRRDGIVAWQATLDGATPGARNVEVGSTHVGMGIDPDVWMLVAEALATEGL